MVIKTVNNLMKHNNPVLLIQSALWEDREPDAQAIIAACLAHPDIVQTQTQTQAQDVAVVLSDDAAIRALNRDFRGRDKPTNVLSFPSDAPGEWGDIILAYETISREADGQGKPFSDHAAHLLLHGFLHLLGYDHVHDEDAGVMEALEIAILAKLGIDNPYESAYIKGIDQ